MRGEPRAAHGRRVGLGAPEMGRTAQMLCAARKGSAPNSPGRAGRGNTIRSIYGKE